MKLIKKKVFAVFMTCLMLCMIFSISVIAATNTFSKIIKLSTTGKTCLSLGSMSENTVVTQVKVYLNAAYGTDSFDVYIESPSGTVVTLTPSTKSIVKN